MTEPLPTGYALESTGPCIDDVAKWQQLPPAHESGLCDMCFAPVRYEKRKWFNGSCGHEGCCERHRHAVYGPQIAIKRAVA